MNASNWVYSLYSTNANIKLNDILLPATHDSATAELNKYTISKDSGYDVDGLYRNIFRSSINVPAIQNILFKVAITQFPSRPNSFITEQAMAGVRGFDLRVYFNGIDEVYQHGTIVWKTRIIDTLNHFNQNFRQAGNDKEIFIFRLSHLRGEYMVKDLVDLLNTIQQIFGNSLRPRGYFNVPVGTIFNNPIIIILDVERSKADILKSKYNWLHISYEIYNDDYADNAKFVNMSGNTLITYMRNRFNEPPRTYIGIRELQAHYQFKTPPIKEIINKLDKSVDLQTITVKDNVNRAMVELLKSPEALNCRSLSVISFDFYTDNILQDIIEINISRLNILNKMDTIVYKPLNEQQ